MPIPTLTIGTIPFALPSQRWSDLSELAVSPGAPDFIPYVMPSQRWGDLSELPVTQTSIDALPFAMPSQRWGDLVETVQAEVEAHPDPDTHPYVITADLDPQPGAVNVPQGNSITIPCGDRMVEDAGVRVLDPLLGSTAPAEPQGLDELGTIITVTIGGGAPVTVLAGGVVAPGWSVNAVLTDRAGEDRGIEWMGRTYEIIPPTVWPGLTTVAVDIELMDYGQRVTVLTYSFTTESDFLRIDSITGVVTNQGGDELICTGLFPIGEALIATLGGQPCYGGSGYGFTCWSSNGAELRCAAPPLAPGSYTFTLTCLGTSKSISPVVVVERPWRIKEQSINECFPPWAGVGRRRMS